MSNKDETEVQDLSANPSQAQMIPGGLDEEKATTKPKPEQDISQSEGAVEAKGGNKGNKMMLIGVVLFLLLIVAVVVVVLFLFVLGPGGKLTSPHYDVFINMMSEDIVLAPKENKDVEGKEAVAHENTLIWLPGRRSDAEDAARLFARQGGKRLTPDTTKIIILESKHVREKSKDDQEDDSDKKDDKGKDEDKDDEADENKTPQDPPKKVELTEAQKAEQKKMQEYYAKTMELMPWVMQGKNLVLPDKNKEKQGDKDKPDAAYWQSGYDQDQLQAQANLMIEIIGMEKEALKKAKGDDYDVEKNKIYIGGFGDGGVVALATYLSMVGSAKSGATLEDLGGVISMSGMQALSTYKKSDSKLDKYKKLSDRNKKRGVTYYRLNTPLFIYYGKQDSSFAGAEQTFTQTFTDDVYKFAIEDAEIENKYKFMEEADLKEIKDNKLSGKGREELAAWLSGLMNSQ